MSRYSGAFFLLVSLYFFSVALKFFFVMSNVIAFGIPFFVATTVYIILVLWPGVVCVLYTLALAGVVIAALIHIKGFEIRNRKTVPVRRLL